MTEKQQLLAELMKLKAIYVTKLNQGTFRVETDTVLQRINEVIDTLEKM